MTSRGGTAELTAERPAKATRASKKASKTADAQEKADKKAEKKNQLVPQLPAVNILSPWVFERMAVSQLRRRFSLAAFVLALVVVAFWAIQGLRVDQAEQVLAVEQAETARLTAETGKLAPVQTFVATVGQQQLSVQNNMAAEIYFSRVLEELQNATPFAANVESVSVALDPNAGSVALGNAPAVGRQSPSSRRAPDPTRSTPSS